MNWHTSPERAPSGAGRDASLPSPEAPDSPGTGLESRLDALIGPYAEFFAYGAVAAGRTAALLEGLLRLERSGAVLDAAIAPLWQALAHNGLTVAEDKNKQRADRLFGLDGKAGLLGELKRYRQIAAQDLPVVPGPEQRELLQILVAFADGLLPGSPGSAGADLWLWRLPHGEVRPSTALALPVYLQSLALLVLVRNWIGTGSGLAEQASLARHRAFLTGDEGTAAVALRGAGAVAAALEAAARAL